MSRALIIIPTYNEIENITIILDKIFTLHPDLNILIVDDNSPDKTFQKVQEIIDTNLYKGHLHLMVREKKEGLAKAYIAGFKYAIEKEFDYIMEMDADLSHDPKYIKRFLENMRDNDLVIGSRYVKGGGVVHWSFLRKLISFGGSKYASIVLGIDIKDATGGFKCFRREVLENIDLDNLLTTGYAFQIEMNYRTSLLGFRIKEIPIVFEDRVAGKSKMSKKIFIEALLKVILLRLYKHKILNEIH
jgi:dolichol-phosphate mannosyltransferase